MSKGMILHVALAIIAFFVLATFVMPANASAADDFLDPGIVSDWTAGYEIVAQTISLDAHPSSIPANGISTSTITAQLKNRKGRDVKVEDVIIDFETNKGTLSSDSAVTDHNGRATITLKSSTQRGIATVRATSDSVLKQNQIHVIFTRRGGHQYEGDSVGEDSVQAPGLTTEVRDMITTLSGSYNDNTDI